MTKWYCTELYPTNAEEEMGIAGDFAVYKAAEVEAVVKETSAFLIRGVERYAELFETAGLGEAKDSVFIQEAQRLLTALKSVK